MKITLEIDAESNELEPLIRMLMHGPISDTDVARAKQREQTYKIAESNARVSQIFLEGHDRNRRKQLANEAEK